jgi:hypothetical protein
MYWYSTTLSPVNLRQRKAKDGLSDWQPYELEVQSLYALNCTCRCCMLLKVPSHSVFRPPEVVCEMHITKERGGCSNMQALRARRLY